jgi:CheY-like chemotaxis protein
VARETPVLAQQGRICALVVGEQPGMRRLLTLILTRLTLEVAEVSSNHQLLGAFGKLPSLVVVDVDPSYEQGMVVWHMLRRHPGTATIPSIFLVEAGNDFIRRLATLAGATVCLDKPFHPRDLRSSVERLLHLAPGPETLDDRRGDVRRPTLL